MGSGLIWYAGERAVVNAGAYKGHEVEILKAIGHDDKVLVKTVDEPVPADNHTFLVAKVDLELLEDMAL